jgi:hypothetical protein
LVLACHETKVLGHSSRLWNSDEQNWHRSSPHWVTCGGGADILQMILQKCHSRKCDECYEVWVHESKPALTWRVGKDSPRNASWAKSDPWPGRVAWWEGMAQVLRKENRIALDVLI